MFKKLKEIAAKLKSEFDFYRRLQKHPDTPKFAKLCLWLAIGYLLLPFDLIPDFLPFIGQLDDMVVVPGLIYLALQATPDAVIQACRQSGA